MQPIITIDIDADRLYDLKLVFPELGAEDCAAAKAVVESGSAATTADSPNAMKHRWILVCGIGCPPPRLSYSYYYLLCK